MFIIILKTFQALTFNSKVLLKNWILEFIETDFGFDLIELILKYVFGKNLEINWFIFCRNNKSHESSKIEKIRIECNHLVRSVSFSLIANLHDSTAFWHRSAQSKQYFLISGHYSGRIRIWDIHSGNQSLVPIIWKIIFK